MTAAADPVTHRPCTIDKDGFRTTFYSMVGQYGAHVDPPAHFAADGMTMDKIPLSGKRPGGNFQAEFSTGIRLQADIAARCISL